MTVGESASVYRVMTGEKEKEKLFEMGITDGVRVTVVKKAPFGSPTLLKVRDFYVALRRETLQKIAVTK